MWVANRCRSRCDTRKYYTSGVKLAYMDYTPPTPERLSPTRDNYSVRVLLPVKCARLSLVRAKRRLATWLARDNWRRFVNPVPLLVTHETQLKIVQLDCESLFWSLLPTGTGAGSPPWTLRKNVIKDMRYCRFCVVAAASCRLNSVQQFWMCQVAGPQFATTTCPRSLETYGRAENKL